MRSSHHARALPGGGERIQLRPRHRGADDGDRAVARQQRFVADVVDEHRRGSEAAVEEQLRNRRGQVGAHGDSDGRVDGAGHHDGEAGGGDDAQRGMDAAERLGFDDEEVRGSGVRHGERVLGLADALVGRDRHIHVPGATTDLDQLVEGGARLLDVLQVERGQSVDGVLGLVDVPEGVRIHPDAALGTEELTHRLHARDVVGERLAGLGDLDLGGAGARVAGEDGPDVGRRHGRNGGVHRDAVAKRGGGRTPAEVDRGVEPGRRPQRPRTRGRARTRSSRAAPRRAPPRGR